MRRDNRWEQEILRDLEPLVEEWQLSVILELLSGLAVSRALYAEDKGEAKAWTLTAEKLEEATEAARTAEE